MAEIPPIEVEIKTDFSKSRDELKRFARDTGEALDPKKLTSFQDNVGDLTLSLQKARDEMKRIKAQDVLDENEFKKVAVGINKIGSELTEAKRRLQNFKNTGDPAVSRLKVKFDSLGASVKNAGLRILGVVSIFETVRRTLLGASNSAREFETAFAGVAKTVDVSEKDLRTLEKQLIRLSKEIPVSVQELSKIAEIGGQLGIDASELSEFTSVVAQLGVTTNLSTEQASLHSLDFKQYLELLLRI